MTELLCQWINEDVRLSQRTDKDTFASQFANGYLFGELLAKFNHQVGPRLVSGAHRLTPPWLACLSFQPDFPHAFLRENTADVRLANWKRLEPALRRLGVPFDSNTVRDVMAGKPGVAARFAYQLYIALTTARPAQQRPAEVSFPPRWRRRGWTRRGEAATAPHPPRVMGCRAARARQLALCAPADDQDAAAG